MTDRRPINLEKPGIRTDRQADSLITKHLLCRLRCGVAELQSRGRHRRTDRQADRPWWRLNDDTHYLLPRTAKIASSPTLDTCAQPSAPGISSRSSSRCPRCLHGPRPPPPASESDSAPPTLASSSSTTCRPPSGCDSFFQLSDN